jgi:valyl-tRNA synthetase
MSKSKGNGVDPEVLIDRYGSDALRFKLVTAGGTGNDQRLEEPRIEAARNFANKLWNAARLTLGYLKPGETVAPPNLADRAGLPVADRWVLSRLESVVENVDRLMGRFELGEAGREVHDFVWDEFCDWYLELAKVRIRAEDEASPLPVMVRVLDTCLRLLHPYVPYVTEEIWSGSGGLRAHLASEEPAQLITAAFPASDHRWRDEAAEAEMDLVFDVVRAVRNIRRERQIDAGRWIEAYLVAPDAVRAHAPAIEALARVRPLHIVARREDSPSQAVASAVIEGAEVVVPLAGAVDVTAERASLEKQLAQARGEVERIEAKLADARFTTRAPAPVVAAERERLASAEGRLAALEGRLAELA